MGFWQLYVFIKVIENGSFSKAAKACGLSQPTISSHIKQLEQHFSCRLVDRIEKKAVPTKVGKRLYDYAIKLIALREEAEASIRDFQGKMQGKVAIGGSTIPGVYLLPELLADFVNQYPDVRFSLDINGSDTIIGGLIKGNIELAIVGALSHQKSISQQITIKDEMMLVVPVGHKWAAKKKIGFEQLKKEPFIRRESGSGTWKSFQDCLQSAAFATDELNVIAEIRHTRALISGIKKGLGVSVISPIAVSEELEKKELMVLHIDKVDLKRNFYLTWCSNRTLSPIAEALKQFIQEKTAP
ncbi:MAG: LysR family transcriptional regulator [Deltaproteobacteria bacterium]|nr:LysR family transcriptional regulator [Deltaproteobacteria bacterium]